MTGFEVYKMYLSLKQHFTKPDYDYYKYNGKVRANEKSFEQTIQIDYTLPFGNNRQKNKKLNKTFTSKKRLKYNKSQSISAGNKIEFGGKFINRDREIIYSDMLNDQYLMSEEFNYNQRVSSSYLSYEFSFKVIIPIKFIITSFN